MSKNPNSNANNANGSKIEQRNGGNKWLVGKRIPLQKPPGIDEDAGYTVVDPRYVYHGKSYSEWITDWFNWFLSADADKRNSGPVVFLRSLGLPNRHTGAYTSDVPGQATGSGALLDSMGADIMNYSKTYVNDPNIRIGGDRLQIFDDQAVLVPIIIAYWLKTEPQSDWGTMQDYTGSTIDHGDDPPDVSQLTINKNNIELGFDMEYFRITTPIFTAVVPDTEYGRSVKDFLEHPISPGSYPAIVEGYFVMLKFEADRSYWVHSWASAPREISGPYFSELLYQIEVKKRRERRGMITSWRPSRNERMFAQIFSQKEKNRDLTSPEAGIFAQYFISKGNNKEIKRAGLVNNKEIKRNSPPHSKKISEK
jgi:hypothetical protein